MPDCVLGIDLGTSGCRGVLIDRSRELLAAASVTLPPSVHPAEGHSEQRPSDWWKAVRAVVGRIVGQRAGRIRALCIDGTSSTLLLSDREGIPLGPALMYDDRRALPAARDIETVAPDDSPARGASSALAKLHHLLADPGKRTASHALHQADWIAGKLTGRFGVSDENNALKMGYDPLRRRWPPWIAALGTPMALLPRVVPVGCPLGTIDTDVAVQLGLAPDLQVIAGTTDSNAAALAAGCDRIGDAVTSLGSTLVLKILTPRPVAAAGFGVYSHRIGERWLAGGASNTGGKVLREYFSDEELGTLSQQLDPDTRSGLDYYPLCQAGERFPQNDPDWPPRLTPVPASRPLFLQGILEGIARIEATGYRRLAELGAPYPARVFTAGGGAVNEAWRRIRERELGVPVHRARHTEAAYGAALLAHRAIMPRPSS